MPRSHREPLDPMAALRRFRTLVEQSVDVILLVGPTGELLYASLAASSVLGYAPGENLGRATFELVHPDDLAQVHALFRDLLTRSTGPTRAEFRVRHKEGSWRYLEATGINRLDEPAVEAIVVTCRDVTDRRQAEESLRATQSLLQARERLLARLLVEAEQLGQTGSWEQDFVSQEIFNTDANLRLFFGEDRRKGTRLEDYIEAIHPDDRDLVVRRREQLLAGTGPGDIEYRVVWPDGSVHWIFGRATIVRDQAGRPLRSYGTNADITERKHAQEELARRAQQLEALSRKLIEAQEAERRAIARELHDDFGQVLTALKLNLQRRDRDDSESIALVDGAITRMRELAQDLRPPPLDEYGLEASLKWYVEREARRAGLGFRLALGPLAHRPPAAIETTCFRVAQEALTNIIRHARARRVEVELSAAGDVLELVLRDDGQGFDVAAARRRAAQGGSQGLLSMQERVTLADGDLDIDSTPSRGTAIRARLPLPARGDA